ncbi:MAG: tetratricopeptide repeat protein [Gammaproteobacteria bacterium]
MSIKTKLQTAIAAHQAQQINEAEMLYLSILQEQPTCTDALNLLGILYAQQQKYEQAVVMLNRALEQEENATTHNHLATCFLHLDNTDKAYYHLEQAIHLNQHYAEAYNNLGNLHQKMNHLPEAKNYYKQAVNLKTDYLDALVNLGTVNLKLHDIDEAKYYLEQVIKQVPNHAAANFQLGNIAYQQHELTQAVQFYEKIPAHANAHLNLGSILLEQGNIEHAINVFKEVLLLNPKHLLAHSNLAAIYITQQQHELAIPHYYEILSQDVENYTSHFNLGAIYMKLRKWETAAYHLSVAIKIKDDDPDAHDNYATTLLKLKQEDLAREHYMIALKLRPDDEVASYRLAALTGNTQPPAAPSTYIQLLFDNYADNFDHELMDALQYKVPEAISKYAHLYLNDRDDLTVVDLGCGTGLCGRYFIPCTKKLIGVDLSSHMLKIAEKKHIYDELITDDMTTALARWHEEIDLITAADSFVYVGDLEATFYQCYQALVNEGYLIFTLEAGYDKHFHLNKTGRYAHHADYIKQLAKTIGFELIDQVQLKLREEKGMAVNGWLTVLKKTGVTNS